MNNLLFFLFGLIFITSAYGQYLQYSANWFLIFGMLFSTVVLTALIMEEILL